MSLRDAVNLANASGTPTTITFNSAVFATPLTITLKPSDPLELSNTSQPTTIKGPAVGVTVAGALQTLDFQIDANVTASLANVNVNTGSNGAITNAGNLTLTQVNVTNSTTANINGGGGIYNNGALYYTGGRSGITPPRHMAADS